MRARIELHFHLLPGVDDGPADMAEALELARLAVADGTGLVVATPHASLVDVRELRPRVAALQAALDAAGIPLEVRAGAECLPDDVLGFSQAELELVAHGPPGRRWVLLEAPFAGSGDGFAQAADELRARGFGVLVAHPERCESLRRGDGLLERELARGAVLQVSASSVVGDHGADAQARALALLRARLAGVLASDAHRPSRPPRLTAAVAALAAAGVAEAAELAAARPAALLRAGIARARAGAQLRV